ncbi:MAG: DUF1499 domain-containing protein [Alphaproteobacteria bacterium]|nr:DUF1499 domain-containing protein [Alphaproteobacteria bacterium]
MRRILGAVGRILIGIFVVYILAAAIFGRTELLALFFGPVDQKSIDFTTLELPATPNTFLACPPEVCAAAADIESPIFAIPVDELRVKFLEMVAALPAITLLASDPVDDQYDIRETSVIFAFPDTMTVRLFENRDGTSTVAIYSRSHYGNDDFGVNERRVRSWLHKLAAEP